MRKRGKRRVNEKLLRVNQKHSDSNYKKAVLESIKYYNVSHFEEMTQLLVGGLKSDSGPIDTAIGLEVVTKIAQVLEEYAVLCLALGGDRILNKRNYLFQDYMTFTERYFHKNPPINAFYRVVKKRKGLSKNALDKIYCLDFKYKDLVRRGNISREEVKLMKIQVKDIESKLNINLHKASMLFCESKKEGFIVNIRNKTKHGFKYLHPTSTSKYLWPKLLDGRLGIIDEEGVTPWGRQYLRLNIIKKPGKADEIKKYSSYVNKWADAIRELVDVNLIFISDSMFYIPVLRYERTQQIIRGNSYPVNSPCPCKSGLKYKKCCGKHTTNPIKASLDNIAI